MSLATSPVPNGNPRIRWPDRNNGRPRPQVEPVVCEPPMSELVGSGPAMRRVKQLIAKIAPSDATVLILGASGTGKELVARAMHQNSPRRRRPLVTVSCAML